MTQIVMINNDYKNMLGEGFMMIDNNYKYTDVTQNIIKAFCQVYNTLGYGFLEKVYENAIIIELKSMEIDVEKQKPIKVYYKENKLENIMRI